MSECISNTSPLLYLYRIGALNWLPIHCGEVRIPQAVVRELSEGQQKGYDVPDPQDYEWLEVVDPRVIPSKWLNLDLGAGELAVLAMALEHPGCTVLLDDRQARRIAARGKSRHGIRPSLHPGGLRCDSVTYSRYAPSSRLVRRAQDRSRCSRDFHHGLIAQAAGLNVWGTLKVLIEAKSHGLVERIATHLYSLENTGMWMSEAIRRRVLALVGEEEIIGNDPGSSRPY